MNYCEYVKNNQELLGERLELVMERVAEIAKSPELGGELGTYFAEVANLLLLQKEILDMAESGVLAQMNEETGKALNKRIYDKVHNDYENSFAEYAFCQKTLGDDYGQVLCTLYEMIFGKVRMAFEGNMMYVTLYAELMVELYVMLQDEETTALDLKNAMASFMHDNSELFMERQYERMVNPDMDPLFEMVMHIDLADLSYLYRYGFYISEDEVASARFLATFSEEELQSMVDTYTEGYRVGFAASGKDISVKNVAEVRYPVGFERMARMAVKNFEKLGMRSILLPTCTSANKQYDFDHRESAALWLSKNYMERRLECVNTVLEKNKEIAKGYGGPAVIEVFGQVPFEPVTKAANPTYDEKQQLLAVQLMGEEHGMLWKYIDGENRSFTIIAYPVASIGAKYEEIFRETVKLNTLDYKLYQNMQQKLIDVLDKADYVEIKGKGANRTDLRVKVWDIQNPEKESAFENCVADVNIPVGEVFTTPVLEGTTGKLHVTQVYLQGLNYLNLEMDFEEGMITSYGCTNFKDPAEGRKYISDNVLMHHETLALGEFAIGTNTTAFKMARDYDIAAKLPILIAEKTGPHFAVGDTCFTYAEDACSYNPDGKLIVARDNSVSIQRKTDPSKAYYNCHTDITIPYDELGSIVAVAKDGSRTPIIEDGFFVVPGTEELNVPLKAMVKK